MMCPEFLQQAPPDVVAHPLLPGYWMWGLVFIAVAAFELWAVITHHFTLTQTVRRGPRWFKWSIGIGLIVLLGHLFL